MNDTSPTALADQYRQRLNEAICAAAAQGLNELATALAEVKDGAAQLAGSDRSVQAATEHRYRFFYPVE